MRKLFIFCISLITVSLFGQNVYLNEDFEVLIDGKPFGWTQEYVSGTVQWRYQNGGFSTSSDVTTRNPYPAKSGGRNALFQFQGFNRTTKLISPRLPLRYATKPVLKFYHAQDEWIAPNNDMLIVYYKTSAKGAWIKLQEYNTKTPDWVMREIDLSNTTLSDNYYIAFEGIANFGWGVCIDSVVIADTEIKQKELKGINVTMASTNPLAQGAVNMPVIKIELNVAGNDGSLKLNSLDVNYTGTFGAVKDNGMKLFQKNDTLFGVSNQLGVGQTIVNNSVSFNNLNFEIPSGNSTLWVTVDVRSQAPQGGIIDAEIPASALKTTNGNFPASNASPSGYRSILSTIFFDDFELEKGWSITGEFQIDTPKVFTLPDMLGYPNPSQSYSGGKNLGVDLTGLGSLPGFYEKNLADKAYKAVSPAFSCRYFKNTSLNFQEYLNMDASDSAYIEYSIDNGVSWKQMWKYPGLSTSISNTWKPISYDTKTFLDRQNSVRFRLSFGKTDDTWELSGWHIDDVFFTGDYIPHDIAVTEILGPFSDCSKSNSENVTVRIKNTGPNNVNSLVPLAYSFDKGKFYFTDTVNMNLAPDSSMIYTFSRKMDLTKPGFYYFVIKSSYALDSYLPNDTMSYTVFSIPSYTLPHSDNFEGKSFWKTGGTSSSWKLDIPQSQFINNPPSPVKAWKTFRSLENEDSYVESPCFDFTGVEKPVIEFNYNVHTDSLVNGASLFYSTDNGANYVQVPKHSYSYLWNWYHGNVQGLGSIPGFSGYQGKWITARQFLPESLSGKNGVKFRFRFFTTREDYGDGFAFDDFKVMDAPHDLGVTQIDLNDACVSGIDSLVSFTIKNFGIRSLSPLKDTIVAGIIVNGAPAVIDSFVLTNYVAPNASLNLKFKKPVYINSEGTYQVKLFTKNEDNSLFYSSLSNDTMSVTFSVYATPSSGLPDTIATRRPDTVILTPTFNPNFNYTWQDNSNSSEFYVYYPGKYYVDIVDGLTACSTSDTVIIKLLFNDIKLDSIIQPITSCNPLSSNDVKLMVRNVGNDRILAGDIINFYYEFDGNPSVYNAFQLTNDMLPQDTILFTFEEKVDLPDERIYNISAYVSLDGDTAYGNDTIHKQVQIFPAANITLGADTISFAGSFYTMDAGDGYKTYKWIDVLQKDTIIGSRFYDAKNYGYHKVIVTDNNDCPATDSALLKLIIYDLGPKTLLTPVSSCVIGKDKKISFSFANLGTDTIEIGETINVGYQLDGNAWVESVVSLTKKFLPKDTIIQTFTPNENFSELRAYNLSYYAHIDDDIRPSNDTVDVTINAFGYPVVDLCKGACLTGNLLRVNALEKVFDAGAGDRYKYKWNDNSTQQTLTAVKSGAYSVTVTDSLSKCSATANVNLLLVIIDGAITNVSMKNLDCSANLETIEVEFTNKGTTNLIKDKDTLIFGYNANQYPAVEDIVIVPIQLGPNGKLVHKFNGIDQRMLFGTENEITYYVKLTGDMRLSNNDTLFVADIFESPEPFNLAEGYSENKDVISGAPILLDAGDGFQYLWQDSTTNRTMLVDESGKYYVRKTSPNGCFRSDTVMVYGINLPKNLALSEGALSIYPNPAQDYVVIEYSNTAREQLVLQLFGMDGKVLLNKVIDKDALEYRDVIDLSAYNKGVYYVRVYNQQIIKTGKLWIQ